MCKNQLKKNCALIALDWIALDWIGLDWIRFVLNWISTLDKLIRIISITLL